MESRKSLTLQRRIEFHAYFILAPVSYGFVWYILTKVKMAGLARWAHLAPSGSQSEHWIRFILSTGLVSNINNNNDKYLSCDSVCVKT